MARPSETAQNFFMDTVMHVRSYKITNKNADLAEAIEKLAQGLYHQTVGQRATYILLAEVKGLLQLQNPQFKVELGRVILEE